MKERVVHILASACLVCVFIPGCAVEIDESEPPCELEADGTEVCESEDQEAVGERGDALSVGPYSIERECPKDYYWCKHAGACIHYLKYCYTGMPTGGFQ